jgi:hypothetical protein
MAERKLGKRQQEIVDRLTAGETLWWKAYNTTSVGRNTISSSAHEMAYFVVDGFRKEVPRASVASLIDHGIIVAEGRIPRGDICSPTRKVRLFLASASVDASKDDDASP